MRWHRFVVTSVAAALALFAVLVACVVALDPHGTQRFALLRGGPIPDQGPRTAHASRGRDPAFQGALIGNSHLQTISPAALTEGTGVPFVSLTVPATGPKEQFALLDYFLRNHPGTTRALVFGIDPRWCTPDEPVMTNPFPFWLYDARDWRYLTGLVRDDSLDTGIQRLLLLTGLTRKAPMRPDGYDDYARYRTWRAEVNGERIKTPWYGTAMNETGRFPQIERLGDRLADLPASVAVVFLRPPVFETSRAPPGTPLFRSEEACRDALARVTARLPRAALVDWRVDRPEIHVPENFFDHTHYRAPIAREIERDVAKVLGELLTKQGS